MNIRKLVAAATRGAAVVCIAGVLAAAGFMLGCDVMDQDIDVTVPWHAPNDGSDDDSGDDSGNDSGNEKNLGGPSGGEDQEDQAQTREVERWL